MSTTPVSRRDFLRAGAAAGVTAAALPALAEETQPGSPDQPIALVPKRKLGRSDVDVSMLNQGSTFAISTRHMNVVHDEGVRYFDTADCYKGGACEKEIGDWLEKTGRRKEYFVVTKDHPRTPEQWVEMVDHRLEVLKTDFIDLYFIHQLGDDEYGGEACRDWPKDKEWAAAADRIRKSAKARLVGFSTHCRPIELRIALLNNAAAGGWVDALMVANNPMLIRENHDFNRALDACHKAGVGLISMKECRDLNGIEKIVPSFEEKGLNAYTAVLSAMWTDGRFASICSHMDNVKKVRENAAAARNFKPLTEKELAAVVDMIRTAQSTYCAACDGSCQRAAGTHADLNSIARYVTYLEQDGQLSEARRLFAALPAESRDWTGADLAAASRACKCNLDFARILDKAEHYFV